MVSVFVLQRGWRLPRALGRVRLGDGGVRGQLAHGPGERAEERREDERDQDEDRDRDPDHSETWLGHVVTTPVSVKGCDLLT